MKKTKVGQELISSLRDLIEYEKGKKRLRTTTMEIPEPPKVFSKREIAAIRKKNFGVSQPIFAKILNVDDATVKAWEQGRNVPSGVAARLLQVAAVVPEVFERLEKNKRCSSRPKK